MAQAAALQIIVIITIVLYMMALFFIFLYSITQAALVIRYLTQRSAARKNKIAAPVLSDYPFVTVQLPLYNERYVAARLIDTVAALDYPAGKLEIQVLDDSTDETASIIALKVAEWKAMGVDIIHIFRDDRTGYKAGALKEGLAISKGEFIAIFDADFLPGKEFLKNTLAYFNDSKVGMVQTRWEHLNRSYSLLTHLQAFGLDAHFSVEQAGRNVREGFINFNGTAGLWRKSCILDAGTKCSLGMAVRL